MFHLPSSVSHLIYEDDGDNKKKPVAPAIIHIPTAAPIASPPGSYSNSSNIPDTTNNRIYPKLKAKTDFYQTETGKAIQEYADSLSSMNLGEDATLKAAILLATKHNNLSPAAVVSTFDEFKVTLQQEQTAFTESCKSFDDSIDTDEKRRHQMELDLQNLTTDLLQRHSMSDSGKSEFASAMATRSSELEVQRSKFANLLKG